MTEDPNKATPTPGTPDGGTPTPPAQAVSPEVAELTKKVEGLTTWINNQNQNNTTLKREVEQMKLERQQLEGRLAELNVRPSPLDTTRQKLAKAIEEQDIATALQAQTELLGTVYGAQTEHLVKSQINQGYQLAARDPDMTPEARDILAKKIFVDGDPKKGPKPLRMQEMASGGSLEEYVEEAKREASGLRVASGDYELSVGDKKVKLKEVIQSYAATEEEKKKQISNQTPVTGGGGPIPQATAEELKKAANDDFNRRLQNAKRPEPIL